MSDDIRVLINQYRSKGILVDTNILLLYFVGAANPKRIQKFNRTEQFDPRDYELLVSSFRFFERIVTTPNILTEVYNLINQIGEPDRYQCLIEVARLITQLEKFEESYIGSREIVELPSFPVFGLTDGGIEQLARDQYLVLTDDLKLANHLLSGGIDVLNFNNLRVYNWT